MNVYIKQKQTHRYRKQACSYQRREEKGVGMRGLVLSYTNY